MVSFFTAVFLNYCQGKKISQELGSSYSITVLNFSNIVFQLASVMLASIPDCVNMISHPLSLSFISIETLFIPEKCHGTSNVNLICAIF